MSIFELNEAITNTFTSSQSGVLSASTIALLLGVVFTESVDSDLSAHVKLISNGSSANVKPIGVIRSKIFIACGLVVDGPLQKL